MEAFITHASSVPTWRSPLGRLHVYFLPDDATADYARGYQDLLDGVDQLSVQPREWLHMTVENLNRHVDDLTATELEQLISKLTTQLAEVDAFEVTVGPALTSYTSVTLDATPDQPWHQVRAAVRAAAIDVLGQDAVEPMTRPGRPHITLGYATGSVVVDPLLGKLNNHRTGRVVMPVHHAHLVAVDVDVDQALFTWNELAVIPIGQAATTQAPQAAGVTNVVGPGARVGTLLQAGDLHGTINL